MTESDDKKLLELVDPALARIASATPAVDVEAALRTVRARMATDDAPISLDAARARKTSAPRWLSSPATRAAAAIIVVAGAVAVWQMRADSATRESVYATASGETKDVTLSDGSVVRLAPGSRMRVAKSFDRKREVQLDGLARFTVQHDASHPFKVRAGDALVEDIGTVFSVRTGNTGAVDVVVAEGSVRLSASSIASAVAATLSAGDRGSVVSGAVRFDAGAATAADMAWTNGQVVFEDATMDRVQSDLRRFYGVEVVIRDAALTQRHLTAAFSNEPIDQIMRTIGLALDAPVERRGDTLFVGGTR